MPEAIILAGGMGTRLQAVIADRPKPMAPIGNTPFLEIIIKNLVNKGFNRIILSTGYMATQISAYFGNNYMGAEIIYSVEKAPLGTGGATKLALSKCTEKYVYIFNGDTYLDLEVDLLQTKLQKIQPPIIVGKIVDESSRYGTLKILDGRVSEFIEKGKIGPGIINAGCYVLNRNQLQGIHSEKFSLEVDFFQKVISEIPFEVFITAGKFVDIGVPEDYRRAEIELLGL